MFILQQLICLKKVITKVTYFKRFIFSIDNKIFKAYSQEEIENFKCIFDMFDQEKTGFVDVAHLQTILKCLGRDPNEAEDLVKDLNPDQNQLSF